tara:strand:- start:585 stop:815 length:231 start_codon:yes stop_codon:yes gene_type:complete
MRAVSITPRIKYFHCPGDEEGAHGVLVLLGAHGYPSKASDINDQSDFKFWFSNFAATEQTQRELAVATPTGYAFSV